MQPNLDCFLLTVYPKEFIYTVALYKLRDLKEKYKSIYSIYKLKHMLLLLDDIHRDISEQHFSTQTSSLESSSHQQQPPSTKTSSLHPENGQLKQPTLPLLQARVAE